MRTFFASALLAAPVLMGSTAAHAQYYNWSYQQIGQFGNGYVQGPRGYYGQLQQNRIGNFLNTTYSDNYGTTNCQTSTIGSFVNTYCY
jgi:hypothetical protein